jgi:(1->4)-alpha-D-glucan 1-alpha-D-glucosylmutase
VSDPQAVADFPPASTRRAASIPTSTYRVQLSGDFTFHDAARLVPYLARLGIGSLYVSPFFKATPGSTHGYDVTDYQELNPELGGDDGYEELATALEAHGLGLLIDFVPNHMGIGGGRNAWWQDVLENGPLSAAATSFDIDWRPLKRELRDKVLLPILGDQYGAVLERGELRLELEEGAFRVQYFEHPLPIAPPTYPLILRRPLDQLVASLAADDPGLLEYQSIITALDHLATLTERTPETIEERQREQIVAKRRLATLLEESGPIAAAVVETVAELNGMPGEPASFDSLDNLLAEQSYRLASWRVAGEEINYRRFFAINELAAIRQEEPDVFARSHARLLELLAAGEGLGVRIDHPDGLWDPAGYFRHLQEAYAAAIADSNGTAEPDPLPLYLVVEKILEHDEALPEDWAVHGTVGYEFATSVNNLLVDPAHRRAFDELYGAFIGERLKLADLIYEAKYLIMRTALMGEVNVLAQALNRISEEDRHTRDFTLNSLRAALREVIANFPVYRTYVTEGDHEVEEQDRKAIEAAVALARRRNPALDPSILEFVRDVLLTVPPPFGGDPARAGERARFSRKFQQLTGPVMAKGLEDTAFYQYNRLVSLNEVGGNPGQFGQPVAAFHRANGQRQRRWPHSMLTTSTHDTKRSEDVRARIDVLSELPQAWRAAINRWTRLNRKRKRRIEGRAAPDRNDEYLLYQTLIGTWPVNGQVTPEYVARIVAYLEKATREAQTHTSWLTPNDAYEAATTAFIEAILDPRESEAFLADFAQLAADVATTGAFNALTQQVLKLTAPGVPDIYQGTELWDLSLVDPDNRRPVDYARRERLLAEVSGLTDGSRLVADPSDGAVKLFVTHKLLDLRRRLPGLFADGDYQPLQVIGSRADHVVAFRRQHPETAEAVIVVAPRLIAGLKAGREGAPVGGEVWSDTRICVEADRGVRFASVFTGAEIEPEEREEGTTVSLAEAHATFPVAVLVRRGEREAGEAR